jgi:hypothetical protein
MAMTPQQWAGIRGMSAGLMQAGAPRVGGPGPSAWAAGLLGMDQSMQQQVQRQRAQEQYDYQKKMQPKQEELLDAQIKNLGMPTYHAPIKGADGYMYNPDGTRAFPKVVSGPDAFRKSISGAPGVATPPGAGGGAMEDTLGVPPQASLRNAQLIGGTSAPPATIASDPANGTQQPGMSVKSMFESFPPQVQQVILSSPDPQKAFGEYAMQLQKKRDTRELSMTGGMIQDQERNRRSGEWENVGVPRSRRGEGMTMSIDAAGNPVWTMGGGAAGDMANPVKTALEKKQVYNIEQLVELDEMGKAYAEEYLTVGGDLKALTGRWKSKLGLKTSTEEKAFLKNRRKFTQKVNRTFNAYRNEITGAAAAMAELESLKEAMLNTDLSAPEFEGAFEEYQASLKRSVRITNMLRRQGVTDVGKKLDEVWKSGGDDNYEARGAELEAQGLNDEGIMQRLVLEGYL